MSIPPTSAPTITVTFGQLQSVGTDKLQFAQEADKQVFLDLVNKAYADKAGSDVELEIPRPLNAGELGLVAADRDRYDSVLSSAFDVLLVLRRLGADMEKSSREAKHAAREGEYQLALKSADKIREAAVVEMVAGIVAGALQIAGGIASAGGSMKAMKVGLEPYNVGGTKSPAWQSASPSGNAPGTTGGPQIGGHRGMPQVPSGGMPPLPSTPGGPTIGSQRMPPLPQTPQQAQSPTGGRPRADAVTADDGAPSSSSQSKAAADARAMKASMAERQAIEKANIEAQGIQGKWNAILQIFMGASSAANSIIGVGAKELEAQKAEIDADVRKMSYKVDDAKESQDTFKQLKEEMQKMFSEFSQTEYQMNKEIWS